MVRTLIGRVTAGEDLSREEMASAVDAMVSGELEDGEIAILLTALAAKGETADEVAGAAVALRQRMTPIRTTRTGLVDTCGTGGDHSGTFNISTAAALVTAAAGVPVAKHGNRSITSKSGSADVLTELGVRIEADVAAVEACIDQLGIGFCFAPILHPAMRRVAAVRRQLGVPTIFNLLGPLCNPASADYQLLGVGRAELRPLLASAIRQLDLQRALVVCGEDGLDEVSLSGPTCVTEVDAGKLREVRWVPADFGLPEAPIDTLKVNGPQESAAVIRGILAGQPGPCRDVVVLNAAAALLAAGRSADPDRCAREAEEAIDSGAAARLLEQLAELSHQEAD